MRSITEFVKTTLVGGVLFLVPLVVVLYVLREAFQIARNLLAPFMHHFPTQTVGGIALATLLSVLLLILVCFVVGLAARTERGETLKTGLENKLLLHVPGYTIVRGLAYSVAGKMPEGMSVALARIEDAWQMAFVLGKLENGLLTVFVPEAPNPMSGAVFYLTEDRVKPLDISVAAAFKCVRRLGAGSEELLRGRL